VRALANAGQACGANLKDHRFLEYGKSTGRESCRDPADRSGERGRSLPQAGSCFPQTTMKPRHPDSVVTAKCQRSNCDNIGILRLDPIQKRVLFVFDSCFGSLQAYELRQLFRDAGRPATKYELQR